jgi:hypothetical protein
VVESVGGEKQNSFSMKRGKNENSNALGMCVFVHV